MAIFGFEIKFYTLMDFYGARKLFFVACIPVIPLVYTVLGRYILQGQHLPFMQGLSNLFQIKAFLLKFTFLLSLFYIQLKSKPCFNI